MSSVYRVSSSTLIGSVGVVVGVDVVGVVGVGGRVCCLSLIHI